jgi:outer membrane protein assembly factor BamB/orotate phosphoribosyltransferase
MSPEAVLRDAIRNRVFVTKDTAYIHATDFKEQAWIFDFRATMLEPAVLNAYAECFLDTYGNHPPFQVAGLEVAAIPLIAAIVMKSHERGTPVSGFFIRKSRKKTGLLKQIEGEVKNLPVILVDDLINSGGSFKKQIDILDKVRNETPFLSQLYVTRVHTILRFRETEAYTELAALKVPVASIFSLNDFQDLGVKNIPRDENKVFETQAAYEIAWQWRGGEAALEHVTPKAGVAQNEHSVFIVTDSGVVVCLNKDTGQEAWRYTVAGKKRRGQFSTPLLVGSTLYIGAFDGNVYALNAQSGARKWVSFEGDWLFGSIAFSVTHQLLYTVVETGLFKKHTTLYALSAETGEVVWSDRLPNPARANVIVSDARETLIVCTVAGDILTFNLKTGVAGTRHSVAPYEVQATPCLSKDHSKIFIGCLGSTTPDHDGSAVFCYDLEKNTLASLYTDLSFGVYGGMTLTEDGLLIVPALDKHIYAIDTKSSTLRWQVDTQSRNFAAPLYIKTAHGPRIFVGTNGGTCLELEPSTGRTIGSMYVVERVTNAPLYDTARNALFVLTYANELYRVRFSEQ